MLLANFSLAVNLHTADATFGAPSGAPSAGDISGWKAGQYGPSKAMLCFDFSDTASMAGPVEVVAYLPLPSNAGWFVAGVLNEGGAIAGTVDNGYVARVFDIPAGATHLQIRGGNPSAGTVTVVAVPLEEV